MHVHAYVLQNVVQCSGLQLLSLSERLSAFASRLVCTAEAFCKPFCEVDAVVNPGMPLADGINVGGHRTASLDLQPLLLL